MAAMLDYECLNCCWVNAHILDETVVVKIWVWTFKSSLDLAKLNSFGEFVMYLIIIYSGHVGFRVLVVDGSISLSYMRSLLMNMWE